LNYKNETIQKERFLSAIETEINEGINTIQPYIQSDDFFKYGYLRDIPSHYLPNNFWVTRNASENYLLIKCDLIDSLSRYYNDINDLKGFFSSINDLSLNDQILRKDDIVKTQREYIGYIFNNGHKSLIKIQNCK